MIFQYVVHINDLLYLFIHLFAFFILSYFFLFICFIYKL